MTDRYVIVVEVDNKRALAAFQKGLDDLEVIWPQVMEEAQKSDDLTAEVLAEDDRKYREELREYKERSDAAAASRKAYEEWKALPLLKRSSTAAPEVLKAPDYYDRPTDPRIHSWSSLYRYDVVPARNSFMAELKRHRDIASAATKPYRMTESDALAMIGWENGERMEWVRRNFLRRAEA